jgi:hypothetical protein
LTETARGTSLCKASARASKKTIKYICEGVGCLHQAQWSGFSLQQIQDMTTLNFEKG